MQTTTTSPFVGPFTVHFRNAISSHGREQRTTPDVTEARALARDHRPWNNTDARIVDGSGRTVPRLPLETELGWRPACAGSGRWVHVNGHKLTYLPMVDLHILESLGDDDLPVPGSARSFEDLDGALYAAGL